MKRSSKIVVKIVFLIVLLSIALGVNAQSGIGENRAFHDDTGMLRFVGADSGVIPAPRAIAGQSFDQTSAYWVNTYISQFGANSSQMALKSVLNSGSRASARYGQVYNGVPVYGAEIVVNVTANGDLIGMSGEVSPGLTLSTVAQVPSSNAVTKAIAAVASRMEVDANSLNAYASNLVVFDGRLIGDPNNGASLSYAIEVTNGADVDAIVFVDATSGGVSLLFNRIDTQWRKASNFVGRLPLATNQPRALSLDISTYDAENVELDLSVTSGTLLCSETSDVVTATSCTGGVDVDADAAHYHAGGYADFLYDEYGRNSIDDNGFPLISTVHYDSGYCNAFWNGSQMTYGDGCPLVVDDVIGHELTHGFTEFTSNLVYYSESGAINESLSDIWGEFYDQLDGHEGPDDGNDYTWRLGEELDFGYTDSNDNPLFGLRDMRDPTIFGDPDSVNGGDFWHSGFDGRGVHINSGISNKTAYLITEGGSLNDINVNGIGSAKALALYYEVQTNWLTEASDFQDLANTLWQACNVLASDGVMTQSDCNNVAKAAAATQLHQTPMMDAGPVADVCPAGHSVAKVWYSEDFGNTYLASGSPEWYSETITGFPEDQYYAQGFIFDVYDAESGNYYAVGPDNLFPTQTTGWANFAIVPDTYPTFLHFEHQYRYEFRGYFVDGTGAGWDSGHVIAYDYGPAALGMTRSTYDGTFATKSNDLRAPAMVVLEPDSGALYDGLGTEASFLWYGDYLPGFVNYSGATSSRFPLSDYAGQILQLGIMNLSDWYSGENGIVFDNVSVYTCLPDMVIGGEFESKDLGDWSLLSFSGGEKVKCNNADKGKIYSLSGDCAFQFRADSLVSVLKYKTTTTDANENDDLLLTANLLSKGGSKAGRILVKAVFVDESNNRTVEKISVPLASLTLNGYTNVQEVLTLETVGTPKKIVTKVVFNEIASSGKLYVDDLHVWLFKDEMAAASSLASSMLSSATTVASDAPRRVDDTRSALPLPDVPNGFRD